MYNTYGIRKNSYDGIGAKRVIIHVEIIIKIRSDKRTLCGLQTIEFVISAMSQCVQRYTHRLLTHLQQQPQPADLYVSHYAANLIWSALINNSERKGIRPVKNRVVGYWHGHLSGRDADLHMPSGCHCHSLSLGPVYPDWFYLPGFTFLLPAHPGSPGHSPGP